MEVEFIPYNGGYFVRIWIDNEMFIRKYMGSLSRAADFASAYID